MIRITKKPAEGQKRLMLGDVDAFVQECARAGIKPDAEIGGTVSLLSKLKTLEAEG